MATIKVNNVTLAYEIMGDGTPLVWTPYGWWHRTSIAYMEAGRLSANHKVLFLDRRNTGASDVRIEDAPSEFHLWTDDLHHLLRALDFTPAYLGGGSNGSVFSLLMAHRYPEDVKGLILSNSPSNQRNMLDPVNEARYFHIARIAENEGMQAVIDYSTQAWIRMISGDPEPWAGIRNWVAETIQMNPDNQARYLDMDPHQFARIMNQWGEFYVSDRIHLANLSDEELSQITQPALVAHGFNLLHPQETAEELHRLLPNSEWVEYSERYDHETIEYIAKAPFTEQRMAILPFVEEFIKRVES